VAEAHGQLADDEARSRLLEEATAPDVADAVLEAVEVLHHLTRLNADLVARLRGPGADDDPVTKLASHLLAAVTALFDFASENVAAVDALAAEG
jgi:hypothetical protein